MDDPLQRLRGDADLQGIATWEPRSAVDRAVVRLHRMLGSGVRLTLLGALGTLILIEIGLFGLGLLFEPLIAFFTVMSVLPAACVMLYVYANGGEILESEPARPILLTFGLGAALVAIPLLANAVTRPILTAVHPLGLYAFFMLIVAPVEEVVKLAAVRFGALRSPSFDAVADGAVYGAVAGLGFATAENAVYLAQSVLGVGLVQTTVSRAAAAPLHVLLTAVAGYYLGLAKFNERYSGPIVLKGLLIVIAAHGVYNVGLALAWPPASVAVTDAGAALSTTDRALAGTVMLGVNGALAVYLLRKLGRYGALLEQGGEAA